MLSPRVTHLRETQDLYSIAQARALMLSPEQVISVVKYPKCNYWWMLLAKEFVLPL